MHESIFSGNAGVVQTILHKEWSVSETNILSTNPFVKGVGEYSTKRNSEIWYLVEGLERPLRC